VNRITATRDAPGGARKHSVNAQEGKATTASENSTGARGGSPGTRQRSGSVRMNKDDHHHAPGGQGLRAAQWGAAAAGWPGRRCDVSPAPPIWAAGAGALPRPAVHRGLGGSCHRPAAQCSRKRSAPGRCALLPLWPVPSSSPAAPSVGVRRWVRQRARNAPCRCDAFGELIWRCRRPVLVPWSLARTRF